MVHEITCDKLFTLPLEDYILTFDDGLYSQYYHFDKIKKINTEKIFFISSGILAEKEQSTEFPSCSLAHEKAFAGNKEDFMTLDQVKELMQDPQVTIGAHSHSHRDLNQFDKLFDKLKHIEDDTQLMLEWFETNLGSIPTKFCYPYNNDLKGMYAILLRKYGFTEFYGAERISDQNLYSILANSN